MPPHMAKKSTQTLYQRTTATAQFAFELRLAARWVEVGVPGFVVHDELSFHEVEAIGLSLVGGLDDFIDYGPREAQNRSRSERKT